MIRRIICAVTMLIFAYKNPSVFDKDIFKTLSDILSLILKVSIEGKPYMTKIMVKLPDIEECEEIVTIWVGSGISASPIKRIAELIDENNGLKAELLK